MSVSSVLVKIVFPVSGSSIICTQGRRIIRTYLNLTRLLIFGRMNFNHYSTMKKIYTLVFVLMACYSAHAQIGSGEKFVGGTFSVVNANGTSSTMVTPEFKYAHVDNRMVDVTAGIVAGGANTAFVIGPNYTWAFPI